MEKFKKEFFIHTSFVDKNDYLRPFGMWEMFQAVAGLHADCLNLGFEDLQKLKLCWVVAYQEFKVVGKLPKYADQIKVLTWPNQTTKIEFSREYEIKDSNDNLLVTAISSWFAVNTDTHKLAKIDGLSIPGPFDIESHYPNFKRKKLNLVPNGEVNLIEYTIKLSDLDHNGHTNNAKYFDIAYNIGYTDCKNIKGGAISFIKEALVGDTIKIKYFKDSNNNDCYLGFINEEKAFEILLEV